MGGLRLGRILGFEISIDWSWLFIFFLVVYSLAEGYFPTFYPGFDVATKWGMGILAALLLFASVLVHELSHSIVARNYGAHVKGITLFLFGGVSQTTEEPRSPKEEFAMAIVGPLASFALAVVFYFLGGAGALFGWPPPALAVIGYLAMINMFLGVFNLVPGFPLDGGRVLRSAIWAATGDLEKATRYASASGQFFGYLLMVIGFGNILAGNALGGLWLIFIGWFLTGAARSSYQQLKVKQALAGVPVNQVMTTDVPPIHADMPIRRFVDDRLLKHEYSCYPVVDGDEVIGVAGIEEVRRTPSDQWETATVGGIAHRIDGAYEIGLTDDAWDALEKLAAPDVCRLIVMDEGKLKGTVGRESVFRLVRTKMQLGI